MEPISWFAETGTAGTEVGCNRPFWLRRDAIEYVRRHGGYVKPLFEHPFGATRMEGTPPDAASVGFQASSNR